jgi:hypothetical protein
VPIPLLLVDVGSVNASIAVARKRAKKSLMFANANERLGNNWATNTIAIGQPILSLGNNTTYLLIAYPLFIDEYLAKKNERDVLEGSLMTDRMKEDKSGH